MYDLLLRLAAFFYRLYGSFNEKARLWHAGRKDWRRRYSAEFTKKNKVLWVHAASLGEFEQGRPFIEGYREAYPDHQIVLTFYSPSGYEIRKKYPGADYVCYLPLDTRANAADFLSIFQPDLAVFVKYEYWFNFLKNLQERSIPVLLISATFREKQPFFVWYGGRWRAMLRAFTHIFVQQNQDKELLRSIDISAVSVVGDTRVDRVLRVAEQAQENVEIARFCGDARVIICGSTWEKDELLLAEAFRNEVLVDYKWLIAPHELDSAHMAHISERFGPENVLFYTKMAAMPAENKRCLVIDTMGMLAGLYRYGSVAYIGGGFGAGIHNTLEPAAFGLPVIFGKKYQKFNEAVCLVEMGGAFAVENALELRSKMRELMEDEAYLPASRAALAYISQNKSATRQILQWIAERIAIICFCCFIFAAI